MNSYHIERNVGRGRRNNNLNNGTVLLICSLKELSKETLATCKESMDDLTLIAVPTLALPGTQTLLPMSAMVWVLKTSNPAVVSDAFLKTVPAQLGQPRRKPQVLAVTGYHTSSDAKTNVPQDDKPDAALEAQGISDLAPRLLHKTNRIRVAQRQRKQQAVGALGHPALGDIKENFSQGNHIEVVFDQIGNPALVSSMLTAVSIMSDQNPFKTNPKHPKSALQDSTLNDIAPDWRIAHQHIIEPENTGRSVFTLDCAQLNLKLIKSPVMGDNCKLQITTMLAVCPWLTNKVTVMSASQACKLDWSNKISLTGDKILGSRVNTSNSAFEPVQINDEKSLLSDLRNMNVVNSQSAQFIDGIFAPVTKLQRPDAITTKLICGSLETTCSTFKKNKDNSDTALSGNPPYVNTEISVMRCSLGLCTSPNAYKQFFLLKLTEMLHNYKEQ